MANPDGGPTRSGPHSVPADLVAALDLLIDQTAAGLREWSRGDLDRLRAGLVSTDPEVVAGLGQAVERATHELREVFGQAVGVEAARRLGVG